MIYVFKTSVKTKKAVRQLSLPLAEIVQGGQWNFDLSDCDNILRIDSTTEISWAIVECLNDNGFACEELSD